MYALSNSRRSGLAGRRSNASVNVNITHLQKGETGLDDIHILPRASNLLSLLTLCFFAAAKHEDVDDFEGRTANSEKFEEDVQYFRQFMSLTKPVSSFLIDCYCALNRHEYDETPANVKLRVGNSKGKKFVRQVNMLDKVCKAFEEGIGPKGRERARTRMLIMEKKSGTIMVLKSNNSNSNSPTATRR